MTIVVEMAGQPIHKGFGFTVACERRRCFVDSVIVGTPADRQGLLVCSFSPSATMSSLDR